MTTQFFTATTSLSMHKTSFFSDFLSNNYSEPKQLSQYRFNIDTLATNQIDRAFHPLIDFLLPTHLPNTVQPTLFLTGPSALQLSILEMLEIYSKSNIYFLNASRICDPMDLEEFFINYQEVFFKDKILFIQDSHFLTEMSITKIKTILASTKIIFGTSVAVNYTLPDYFLRIDLSNLKLNDLSLALLTDALLINSYWQGALVATLKDSDTNLVNHADFTHNFISRLINEAAPLFSTLGEAFNIINQSILYLKKIDFSCTQKELISLLQKTLNKSSEELEIHRYIQLSQAVFKLLSQQPLAPIVNLCNQSLQPTSVYDALIILSLQNHLIKNQEFNTFIHTAGKVIGQAVVSNDYFDPHFIAFMFDDFQDKRRNYLKNKLKDMKNILEKHFSFIEVANKQLVYHQMLTPDYLSSLWNTYLDNSLDSFLLNPDPVQINETLENITEI